MDLVDPGSRRVYGVGLQLIACWDCRFESDRGAWKFVFSECFLLLGRSLIQRTHTECDVSD